MTSAATPWPTQPARRRRLGIGVGIALILAGGAGLAWYVVAHRAGPHRAPVVAPADAAPVVAPAPAPAPPDAAIADPGPTVIDANPATAPAIDAGKPHGTTRGPRHDGSDAPAVKPTGPTHRGSGSGSGDCDPMRTLGGC